MAVHIDRLHEAAKSHHLTELDELLSLAANTGHSESEAASAYRSYDEFGTLPAWANQALEVQP